MEKRFLLSQKELNIPCVLSCPDSGDVRRVVLGVHGFGGSAADPIQEGIAEEMVLFRAATLRFDFPAHGESPMDSEAFTLENCVATLLAVAAYAKAEFPEVEDLCVFRNGVRRVCDLGGAAGSAGYAGKSKACDANTFRADA